MPVTITITGATAEEADAELRQFAGIRMGLISAAPQTIAEVEAETEKAATPPSEETKRRGRPKKDPEFKPLAETVLEPKTMTAAQAEEYMNGSKLPPEPVTLEQCLEAMRIVAAKHSYDEVRRLMTAIGYPKVSLLPEEKRAEFVAMAQSWEPAKAAG